MIIWWGTCRTNLWLQTTSGLQGWPSLWGSRDLPGTSASPEVMDWGAYHGPRYVHYTIQFKLVVPFTISVWLYRYYYIDYSICCRHYITCIIYIYFFSWFTYLFIYCIYSYLFMIVNIPSLTLHINYIPCSHVAPDPPRRRCPRCTHSPLWTPLRQPAQHSPGRNSLGCSGHVPWTWRPWRPQLLRGHELMQGTP